MYHSGWVQLLVSQHLFHLINLFTYCMCLCIPVHVTTCTCHGYTFWGQRSTFFHHIDPEDQPQVCRLGSSCLYQWSCFANPMLWHIIWVINTVIITTNNTSCEFLCSQIWYKFISKSSYRKKNTSGILEDPVFIIKPWVCTLLSLALKQYEKAGQKRAAGWPWWGCRLVGTGLSWVVWGGVNQGSAPMQHKGANALHTRSPGSEKRRRPCADTSHFQQATVTRHLRCSLIWIYTWWGLLGIALLQTFNFSEARQPKTINQRRHFCSSQALGPGNKKPNHDLWAWSSKAWLQHAPRPANLLPPLASYRPCHGPRSLLNMEYAFL